MNAGHIFLADQHAAAASLADATEPDKAALDRLIREHQSRITRLVRRLMAWPGESAEVDDVVQEVFLAAWVKRHQFRGDASAATWLTRIAINKTRNYARSKATWRRVVEQFGRMMAHESSRPDTDANEINNDALKLAINKLKPSDRELIVLRYLEENSPEEIAELTGQKRNTIDARLSRARKRLKELME